MSSAKKDIDDSPQPILRVLILEDNPRDAKLTASVLERGGYKVQSEVTDSMEVFGELLENADYDVILADFNLRNWTALDALGFLKQSGKDIPLIVVTGSLGDEAAVECIKQGAADFVLKDRPARLPTAVQRALEDHRLRNENQRAFGAISRLASIVESSDDAIIGHTLEGVITSWNKCAEKLFVYSAGEVLGQPISVLVPPERSEEVRLILASLQNGVPLEQFDSVRVRKDGRLVDVSLSIFPITGPRGDVTGAATIARDIRERKGAEQARRESEEKYRVLYESSRDAIMMLAPPEWEFTAGNPTAIALFGARDERAFAEAAPWSLSPEYQPDGELSSVKARRMIEVAMEKGSHFFEWTHKKFSGEEFQADITLTRMIYKGKTFLQATVRDITERKRAEEALKESEQRFRTTFEDAAVGMVMADLEGHFIKSNPAFQQMLGYSEEELACKVFTEFTHPDDRDSDWRLFTELVAGECEKYEIEKRYLQKGGGLVWGLLTCTIIKDRDGRPLYGIGMVQDITKRKRAEEALRKSEEWFRLFMNNSPTFAWMKDEEGRYVYLNQTYEKFLGVRLEDQRGKTDFELYPRAIAEQIRKNDQAALAADHPIEVIEESLHPDGKACHWLAFKFRLRDVAGQVLVAGIGMDITERERAEAEHVRLVTAIEQSAEGVVITDTSGNIEYVNPAFTRITGYSREEALGQNPRILKSGKQDPVFYQQLWATILQGEIWHGELINQRKDGKVYTEELNIAPVRDTRGEITHFIATKQDVTERKTLEAKLQQAAKMESIGRLAGGVAHDFNNLLTIINGYSDILLEKLASDSKASGQLKEIKDAGDRAASLTRQLLAFSRSQMLEPRVLDLNSVVSNLEKMLKRLIGEDIQLRTVLDPSLGRVKADPGQIEQVIMNLAVNARDAMPTGGKLTIETSNVELDEDYARTHATVKAGPHVMLAVGDTGVGMTPETKARVFEPFFTTKELGKGTGLGLATVYGIVKQSGGSIWVYSEVGQGTVFKIYLPTVSEAPAPRAEVMTQTGSASGSETVLVVEDEEGVRSLIHMALVSSGYKVMEFADPESALTRCANYEAPIHLLLTDVVMPKMSGPLVAQKVTSLRPGVKVLYMSGYTDDAVVRHGVLSEGTPFIQKPFSPVALRQKIREVLGGSKKED